MKKLALFAFILCLLAFAATAALGAVRNDARRQFSSAPNTAIAVERDTDLRLRFINETLSPDTIATVDWICDGVAPCVALG